MKGPEVYQFLSKRSKTEQIFEQVFGLAYRQLLIKTTKMPCKT